MTVTVNTSKKRNFFNKQHIVYELKETFGNVYSLFFGIVLPIFISSIGIAIVKDIPENARKDVISSFVFQVANICVLSICYINYAIMHAESLTKGIIFRLKLFGFSPYKILISKIISYLLYLGLSMFVYFIYTYFTYKEYIADIFTIRFLLYLFLVVIYAVSLIILAHGIATIVRSVATTYAFVMISYFLMMIVGGSMGVQYDRLPKALRVIAIYIPSYHLGSESFMNFMANKGCNLSFLIQGMTFFLCLSLIIFIIGVNITKNKEI